MTTSSQYTPDPEKVADAVRRSKNRAEKYIKDPQKSKDLLNKAYKKTGTYENSNGPLSDFWRDIKTLMRLLKAYLHKDYTRIGWGSIITVIAAIIYFVSPIDLVPDWFPLAGFVDDAAVVVFVIAQIRSDLARFAKWEQEAHTPPPVTPTSTDIIDL
jgi:uncharacterized membrane protein YkvA (DUF1232 family)